MINNGTICVIIKAVTKALKVIKKEVQPKEEKKCHG